MLSYKNHLEFADCEALAPRLRQADVDECKAASGESPRSALLRSLTFSLETGCALEDGKVIAAWGLGQPYEGWASPWLVGAPEMEKYGKRLVRDARSTVTRWADHFNLINYVSAANTKRLPWLRALGFTLGPLEPEYGHGKLPFHRFHRYRNV